MRVLHYFALTLCLISASCKRNPLAPSERATREVQKMEAAYSSPDIQIAQRAVLDYKRKIESVENPAAVGINVDQALGIAHGRLFLISKKLNRPEEAQVHFESSVKCFQRWHLRLGRKAPSISEAELIDAIEKLDASLEVRWKRVQ